MNTDCIEDLAQRTQRAQVIEMKVFFVSVADVV